MYGTQLANLPPGVQVETVQVGTQTTHILTYMDGRYRLWPDELTAKWRWALREWPDDNLSVPAHGSAVDLASALQKCQEHMELRASLVT